MVGPCSRLIASSLEKVLPTSILFWFLTSKNRLHVPLTIFAEEAVKRSSLGTARTYLHAAAPFFGWLEADDWQREAHRRWNDAPENTRQAVQDYLVERLKCKVKEHRTGFQLVSLAEGTPSTVRIFVSALKLYYRVMQARNYYDHAINDHSMHGIQSSGRKRIKLLEA